MRVKFKLCVQCGEEFSGDNSHGRDTWRRRKYCSQACKVAAQKGRRRAPVLTKACETCGRKFQNRRLSGRVIEPHKWATARFCSQGCRAVSMKGKIPHNKGQFLDLHAQFEKHVDKGDHPKGCWVWLAHKTPAGYGRLQVRGKSATAHRISYILHNGPIPEGEGFHGTVVRHTCDNPSCVNPDHLELGTQYQNMRDRDERGRRVPAHGAQHGMAKLTEKDVIAIRALHRTGHFSQREIGNIFSVSFGMVSMIINRKNWTHL